MRISLILIISLCLVACTNTKSDTLTSSIRVIHDTVHVADTNKAKPIKLAKKTRNCASKQQYEGSRGGVFHYDTAASGNVYKHYTTK